MGEVDDDDKKRHNVKTYSTVTQQPYLYGIVYVMYYHPRFDS